jgi:thermitase
VKISLKICLFLTIIIASLFTCWKGVSASLTVPEMGYSADVVSSLRNNTLLTNSSILETKEIENDALPSSLLPGQYSQSTPDLKSQWALAQIHSLPSTRNIKSNSPILVAVLDTGIDKNHEDLRGKVVGEINLSSSPTADDIYGHGTPIAGIIAADIDNNLGMTGLAPESRLLNVKVADDEGKCRISTLAAGIIWAVEHGAKVINISIELKESTPVLKEAVDYAWNHGAIIIAAAGNDGDSRNVYPAAYDNCIAVTALRENGTLAPLANYGDWVDAAAPGLDIYTTLPDNRYGYKHGTSFATAYVSGLAALLFSMSTDTGGDDKLNERVRRAIEAGCDATFIAGTGKGNINVAGSIDILARNQGASRNPF